MNVPSSIEIRCGDGELDKYMAEFAGIVGGWTARRTPQGETDRDGCWIVGGGALLATNPNAVPWRIRVRRDGGRLTFRVRTFAAAWTRRKARRIAAWRQGQLADFLETRLRGGPPEKFDRRRMREPFSPFGSDPAAVSASFAWAAASACGALAAALLALLPLCLVLMDVTIADIAGRARAVEAAGEMPLPGPAELASIGFGTRLGAAVLFALPAAFFLGLLHAATLLAGEAWLPAARLGQASFAFQAILLALAFTPLIPFWVAIPSALLPPLATQAGYCLVWGRRRERIREGAPPRRAVVAAGVLAAAAAAAAFVPRPAGGEDYKDGLVLFRDRYMVGHPLGKAAAHFYYRYTLYAADPVKRFFAADPETPQRSRRTARVAAPGTGGAAEILRDLDFSVVEGEKSPGVPFDVEVEGSTLRSGGVEVRWAPSSGREGLKEALDVLSARAFRGGRLRDLSWLSWRAVYHAGPLFAVILFVAICCPWISILFRVMSRRAAVISLLACLASTGSLMLWDYGRQADVRRGIEELRASPGPEAIARALCHSSIAVRHEAAYRAYKLKGGHAALAEALLVAAGDADLRVRLWAVAALGKTRDARAQAVLLERLGDPELLVRYRAAEGLGFIGDQRAVDPLLRMMSRGSWYEGLYALEALRRILPERF